RFRDPFYQIIRTTMKALIVTNMYPSDSLPYSGVFIKAQYDYLQKNISTQDKVDIFYMRQVISQGVFTYLKYLMAYIRFIPHLLKKYDVIHVHFLGMLAPVAAIYKFFHPGAQTIVTLHGGDVNSDMPEEGAKNRFFRKLIKKFDLVIPVGPSLHEPLKRKLDADPNNTICAGVDHQHFFPLNIEKKYDFVVVGSFLPVKGLDLLVEALNHPDSDPIRICFVGNGPLEPLLHELKGKHKVTILKNKSHDELREIYNQSKFLLFTSVGDAFGLVVTEAIFCGTPAIVSKNGGGAHQIIPGVNGFVYHENSVEAIREAIAIANKVSPECYKNLRKTTADTNHQFALQTVCQVYYNYYIHAEKHRGFELLTS
ncbi:MAG: glycosyltransferase family 4 protein, partial [Bacteroidota bacterium]